MKWYEVHIFSVLLHLCPLDCGRQTYKNHTNSNRIQIAILQKLFKQKNAHQHKKNKKNKHSEQINTGTFKQLTISVQ